MSHLKNKVRPGVEALNNGHKWEKGDFKISFHGQDYKVCVVPDDKNPRQAHVYAIDISNGRKSRNWAIPSPKINDGIKSSAGSVYDITYGHYG